MRKLTSLFFAFAMLLSVVFVSNAISENNPFSAQAQTRRGKVTVKKRNNGIASRTVSGSKYIYRKSKNGIVYIYRKSAKGTVYVGKKTYQGGKYVTKKTIKGTKFVGKKVVKGTKSVFSRTKKIVQ